jgi:hypothetical protein
MNEARVQDTRALPFCQRIAGGQRSVGKATRRHEDPSIEAGSCRVRLPTLSKARFLSVFDTTKNSRRRWCEMHVCGSRAGFARSVAGN